MVYLTVSVFSLWLAVGKAVSGLGLPSATFKAGGSRPFLSAFGFEPLTAGFHFSGSVGVERQDSASSTASDSRSWYELLTSVIEVSFSLRKGLVCLGWIHPSLSGLASFSCRLFFFFFFFFSGALLQAVKGSTVAGLVRFPKQPVQQVETFSAEDNFSSGGLLCHTPNTLAPHRVLLF